MSGPGALTSLDFSMEMTNSAATMTPSKKFLSAGEKLNEESGNCLTKLVKLMNMHYYTDIIQVSLSLLLGNMS